MKLQRNYLTSEEINIVVNAMLQQPDLLNRECVKVGVVAQLLVEDLGKEYKNCNDIYNDYMAQDDITFELDVKNYNIIDLAINDILETKTEKLIREVVEQINAKIDSVGDFNAEDIMKQISEIEEVKDNLYK